MRPRRVWSRLARSEAGFTIVELLVASAMGVVLLGVAGSLVISAVRDQPNLSKRAQSISSARWVLERLTREIRNGIAVDPERAKANEVSFRTYVRHATCGGSGTLSSTLPSIECQVTYTCTTTRCSRIEAAPDVYTGTATTIIEGIDDSSVFSYSPNATAPTYVGVTLQIPNPDGTGGLTVSDGASLRNATLAN
jgi:type II secretory pathway pseudopilin PulG